MQAPQSPVIRRILRERPGEAYKLTQAARRGQAVRVILGGDDVRYYGSSPTGRVRPENVDVTIDLTTEEAAVS